MKNIFQLRKQARRISRRLKIAKREWAANGGEPLLAKLRHLESLQRLMGVVADRQKHLAEHPFRDATPHKRRAA